MDARAAFDAAGKAGVGHNGHQEIARPGRGRRSSGLKRRGMGRYQPVMASFRFLALALAAALSIPAVARAQEAETPYWASIRSSEVNMRVGPGEDYRILWVYRRPMLPMKVLRVKEGWRYVRDPEGAEGWVLARFLTRERTGFVTRGDAAALREKGEVSARLLWKAAPGVVGKLGDCAAGWCEFAIGPRKGFVEQTRVWGSGEP